MSKAAEAFRTIAEVAEDLEVPKHVLRFWEAKFPQIRPMKRGGGRRYYRPEDMELLRGIRHLLHAEGYTIKGVQKILREHGIDQVKAYADKAAKLEASTPKAKRGRKPAATTTSDARKRLDGTPNAALAKAAFHAGAERDGVINALLAELEMCRRLLALSVGENVPSVAPPDPMRSPPVTRRRTAG